MVTIGQIYRVFYVNT